MEYRFLGRTGLNISPICFGTVNFGNPLVEKNCKQLIDLIVKLNRSMDITFFIATHDKRFLSISENSYKLFNGDLAKDE